MLRWETRTKRAWLQCQRQSPRAAPPQQRTAHSHSRTQRSRSHAKSSEAHLLWTSRPGLEAQHELPPETAEGSRLRASNARVWVCRAKKKKVEGGRSKVKVKVRRRQQLTATRPKQPRVSHRPPQRRLRAGRRPPHGPHAAPPRPPQRPAPSVGRGGRCFAAPTNLHCWVLRQKPDLQPAFSRPVGQPYPIARRHKLATTRASLPPAARAHLCRRSREFGGSPARVK